MEDSRLKNDFDEINRITQIEYELISERDKLYDMIFHGSCEINEQEIVELKKIGLSISTGIEMLRTKKKELQKKLYQKTTPKS